MVYVTYDKFCFVFPSFHTNLVMLVILVNIDNLMLYIGFVVLFFCSGIFEVNYSKDVKIQGIIVPYASLDKVCIRKSGFLNIRFQFYATSVAINL